MIQYHATEDELGTVLAGNNWFQNVVMITALGLTMALAVAGVNSKGLFHGLALVALMVPVRLSNCLIFGALVVGFIFRRAYRLRIEGFENLPTEKGVLLLGNHVTFIDWLIIQLLALGRFVL